MTVGIVGLGLMGGSLGRALKKFTGGTVYGFDVSEEVLSKAVALGCVDGTLSAENAGEVELMVVGVYPSAFLDAVGAFLPFLREGATVIDIAGNKRIIRDMMAELSKQYPNINFMATHPMAGREFSGVEHSTANLFENCFWLICPVRGSDHAISALKRTLTAVGARKLVFTSSEEHDKVIAYTSQLCHIASSAYIKSPTAEEGTGYTAGSFRDLTRVAKLNPDMWTELFIQNSDNLIKEIEVLIANLNDYLTALKDKDERRLSLLLADGSERKIRSEKKYAGFIKNDRDS